MESCAGRGFSADEIITGYLSAARIEAGTITASHLAAGVGQSIDLSANSTITGMQTTIRLMPESIMQTVNNTYSGVKTTVEQNASSWSAKVDQNGVINAINVSTEGATINASKISLIGHTTINNGFSIDQNGYMTAKNGGSIAGWTIGTDTLYSGTGASRVGLRSGVTGDNVVIYAGSSTLASAPFRVTASGKVTCTNLTVTGGSISGTSINIGSGAFTVSTAGAVSCSNLTVTGGSISGASINIGNGAFQVTTAGAVTCSNITATGGKIGGWTIDQYGNLYSASNIGGSTSYTVLRPPTSAGWTFRSSNVNQTHGCFIDHAGNMVIGNASSCVWSSDGTMTMTLVSSGGQMYFWNDGRCGFNNTINIIAGGYYRGFLQGVSGYQNAFELGYSDEPDAESAGCYMRFYQNGDISMNIPSGHYFTVVGGGQKNRLFTTEHYGAVTMSAYETPTPMFGDIGEGIIGADGYAYIDLDPVFAETISTSAYQVFIQAYDDGTCFVKERYPAYFIVCGTPNMRFGWEVKSPQKDYINTRMERLEALPDYQTSGIM